MSVAARMMRGSAWLAAARMIVNASAFLNTIILARLLMPSDFGLVALALTTHAVLIATTDMSLAQALVHHREPGESHFHTAWSLNIARGVALALVMVAMARPVAYLYGEPRLAALMVALGGCMVLNGLLNPKVVTLAKQLIFWPDMLITVSDRLVSVLVSITVALVFQSYWALIVGFAAGQLVSVVMSYIVVPFRPRPLWTHARELWSFSIWLTLGQAMNTINWRFDQLLVGHFLGRSSLGYYAVADNLAQIPTREATTPLTHTLFPALARIADDPVRLRAGYQRAQTIVTAVALPVGVGFALVAKPLVLLAMGEKWLPAVPIIQALSGVFAVHTLGSMVQLVGMAKGATRLLFKRDVQMFCVRLPVIIGAMLAFGLQGLIAGRVATGLLTATVNMMLVGKLTGLSVLTQIRANLRGIVAAAAMAAVVTLVGFANPDLRGASQLFLAVALARTVLLGGCVYLGTTALLWVAAGRPAGPERELMQLLARLVARLRPARVPVQK